MRRRYSSRATGREKVGDGTVAACAQHTIDNYHRLAAIARRGHSETTTGQAHDMRYSGENVALPSVLAQLSVARDAVSALGYIEGDKLDSVPTSPPETCQSARCRDSRLVARPDGSGTLTKRGKTPPVRQFRAPGAC